MHFPDEIPEQLVAEAVEVGEDGVASAGWSRPHALAVLQSLEGTKVSIDEGEVYEPAPGGYLVVDNWHCHHVRGETATDYAERSRGDARGFVSGYRERTANSAVFVMVFSDQQDAA